MQIIAGIDVNGRIGRALLVLLALALVAAPVLPRPHSEARCLMGSSASPCCCMAHPAAGQAALAPEGHGKPSCCHQTAEFPPPHSGQAQVETVSLPPAWPRQVVALLAPPPRHVPAFADGSESQRYPDRPPCYLRWGAFLT